MVELSGPLRARLGLLLLKSHRAVKRLAEAQLAPLGIAPTHMGVLEMLRAHPGLSQAALSTTLEIDRTSIGTIVTELEMRGIVERQPDPADGRGYTVRLTSAGRALADKASARAITAQAQFLAPLSETEQQQLVALLQRALGLTAD